MNDLERHFTDSAQVESSFYEAFCGRNLDLMQKVWEPSDDVICIHPGSTRIFGFDLIIASWQQIFSSPQTFKIEISEPSYNVDGAIAIHWVKEILSMSDQPIGVVLATNIYRKSASGWRMIAHHASSSTAVSNEKYRPNLH